MNVPAPRPCSCSSSDNMPLRISRSICEISIDSNCCARSLTRVRSEAVAWATARAVSIALFMTSHDHDLGAKRAGGLEGLHDGDDVARRRAEAVERADDGVERRALFERDEL